MEKGTAANGKETKALKSQLVPFLGDVILAGCRREDCAGFVQRPEPEKHL